MTRSVAELDREHREQQEGTMMNNKALIEDARLQLDRMLGQFATVLPKHIPAERFGRVVLTAVQTTPELLNVERRSLWNACMRAAQDGLLPDGRLAALVVFKDKKRGPIAQYMPMIAGIRQKIRNSGEVSTFDAHVVHEKDLFDYELGDDPHIVHRPVRGDRGKIIAAYSVALLKDGSRSREVMWIDEIEQVRKMSRAGDGGPWVTWYGEMCKKTVARRHAKVLPMSSDIDDLLRQDDGEPGDGIGPAVQPKPARRPGRTLTDALNMVASLPPGEPNGGEGEVIHKGERRQVSQMSPAEKSDFLDDLEKEARETEERGDDDQFDLVTGEVIDDQQEGTGHGKNA
jgi:recombination protein RecT